MNHLPPIISDLALILLVAGVVTVIVRKLKQPLVLGYIVAGFLASPHMPYMPSVQDHSNIEVWSEIGVIFLMFVLGLEFSLKKVASMGMRPVVASSLTMAAMVGVGATMGQLLGWSNFDSLFLGGMLSISSTTIIYKALEDLGWLSKRFAQEVFSVLILEDILGILLIEHCGGHIQRCNRRRTLAHHQFDEFVGISRVVVCCRHLHCALFLEEKPQNHQL